MNTDRETIRRMREEEIGGPLCAVISFLGPCPYPATAQVSMGCVHEHMPVGPMCADHAENAAGPDSVGDCRACRDAGHDCPLQFISAVPA